MAAHRADPPLLAAIELQVSDCTVRPLDLTLNPGDRVGLRSTHSDALRATLRTLARLQRPAGGRLFWGRTEVTHKPKWSLSRHLRTQVLLIWADPYALFTNQMQVRAVVGTNKGESASTRLQAYGLSPALLGLKIGSLSGVERVRLTLAYVQRQQPRVILVDDVFAHLIPETWPWFLTMLEKIAGETGAVVIASRLPEAIFSMTRTLDVDVENGSGRQTNLDN